MERPHSNYNLLNTQCMEKCKVRSEETCTADCEVGAAEYKEACSSNGGSVLRITQSAHYNNDEKYNVASLYCISDTCSPKKPTSDDDAGPGGYSLDSDVGVWLEAWEQEFCEQLVVPGFFGTQCDVEAEYIDRGGSRHKTPPGKAAGIAVGVLVCAAVAGTFGFMYYRVQAGYTSSFFTAPWASSATGSGVYSAGTGTGAGGSGGVGSMGGGASGGYNAVP